MSGAKRLSFCGALAGALLIGVDITSLSQFLSTPSVWAPANAPQLRDASTAFQGFELCFGLPSAGFELRVRERWLVWVGVAVAVEKSGSGSGREER